MLIFPEGGRSPKHLREFKDGAAYIAIKAGVPAVPVALSRERAQVLPMHSKQVHPGPVKIRIGDPIETTGPEISRPEYFERTPATTKSPGLRATS